MEDQQVEVGERVGDGGTPELDRQRLCPGRDLHVEDGHTDAGLGEIEQRILVVYGVLSHRLVTAGLRWGEPATLGRQVTLVARRDGERGLAIGGCGAEV